MGLAQLRMLLQEDKRLMPERKTMLTLVKDEEDHLFAQFLNEVDLMKKMMKMKDKRHAEFQNDMDSLKMLIKVQGQQHAQFQNAMDLVKNTMKMENKCRTKFRDEMDSMTVERECLRCL
jgi:hypothetical protein